MSPEKNVHQSETSSTSNTDNGVLIVNRFKHARKRSFSSTTGMNRRPLHPGNLQFGITNDTPANPEASCANQMSIDTADCSNKHSRWEEEVKPVKKSLGPVNTANTDASPCSRQQTESQQLNPNNLTENLCKACGNSDCIIFKENKKICKSCGAFSLISFEDHVSIWPASEFYNQRKLKEEQEVMSYSLESAAACGGKKKMPTSNMAGKPGKQKQKISKAVCLTISSDEEVNEDMDARKIENVKNKIISLHEVNRMLPSASNGISSLNTYKIPKLSDRMKQKGTRRGREEARAEREIETDNDALMRDLQFDLTVGYVQFGALPGKAISSLTLTDSVLRVDIECSYHVEVDGQSKKTTEKYSLALSSVEVCRILISCEEKPLVICAVPTKKYSDVVNLALKGVILDAESDIAVKRQMTFVIDHDPVLLRHIVEHHMDILNKISTVHQISQQTASGLFPDLPVKPEREKTLTRTYNTRNKTQAVSKHESARTMFVYPPPPSIGGIAITTVDIKCLDPGTYLNDTIIDFYLMFLVEEKLPCEMKDKTYLFNSYFYTRLSKKVSTIDRGLSPAERMHSQVKKWTRNVDIFEKDFIIIPVNEHSHWFLVVICFPSLVQDIEKSEPMESISWEVNDKEVSQNTHNANSDARQSIEAAHSEQISTEAAMVDSSPVMEMQIKPPVDEKGTRSPVTEMDKSSPVTHIHRKSPVPPAIEIQSQLPVINIKIDTEEEEACNLSSIQSSEDSPDDLQTSINRQSRQEKQAGQKQPCILIFDSLISGGRSRVFANLRQYLTTEWKEKRGTSHPEKIFDKNNIRGSFPKIPLQNNDCDCGVFVLQFAESFFEGPIDNFKAPIKKEDWFTKEQIDKKRIQVKELIEHMEEKYISSQSK